MSDLLLFEGLAAPAPLAGKVQATMVLETEALDAFLHELLKAVQLIGKDMNAIQVNQKETSASVQKAMSEVQALKKDVAALKEQKQPENSAGLEKLRAELRELQEQELTSGVKDQLRQLKKEVGSNTERTQELEATQKKQKSSLAKLSDSVAALSEQFEAAGEVKTFAGSPQRGGSPKPSASRLASTTSTVLPDDHDNIAARADALEQSMQQVLERLDAVSADAAKEASATREELSKVSARLPAVERQLSQLQASAKRAQQQQQTTTTNSNSSPNSNSSTESRGGRGGGYQSPSLTTRSSSSTNIAASEEGGGGVRSEVEDLNARVAGLEEESERASAQMATLEAKLSEREVRSSARRESKPTEAAAASSEMRAKELEDGLRLSLSRDLEALRRELTDQRASASASSSVASVQSGIGRVDLERVRETIAGVVRRAAELAGEVEVLRKAAHELPALKTLAEQAEQNSARNSEDTAALSMLFKEFIASVNDQLHRLQTVTSERQRDDQERVSRSQLQETLQEVTAQWDEQLSGALKEMRDLRLKVAMLEERRSAAALQRCLSCRHPVSDPRQVLYWSVPRVDQQIALAPVTDGKVYRVTSDHEVTLGTTLPPPNRPSASEHQREEDAPAHETPHQALPQLPRSEQSEGPGLGQPQPAQADPTVPCRPRTPPSSFRRPHAQHPALKPRPHSSRTSSSPLPLAPSS